MPNTLNQYGLTIEDINETLDKLNNAFRSIYGYDINLDSNTPDGQIIAIASQIARDNAELALSVYNSFDLTKCTGVILDIRVALLGLVRKGGTYSQYPFNVTVDRAVTLAGLDENYNNAEATSYTINYLGTEFYLIDSVSLAAGVSSLNFRAKDVGNVTITTGSSASQTTVVLGVTAIQSVSGALQIGEDQETDEQLRLRADRSKALASNGYLNGLEGKLLNLSGVTEAKVYENNTKVIDVDGTPGNTIWCVVEGGSNEDIADTIYRSKMPGCGMRGLETRNITRLSGDVITIKWDRVQGEDLYIRFDLKPTKSGVIFDLDAIKEYIETNLTYILNEYAETSKPTAIARDAINNSTGFAVPLNLEVGIMGSTGIEWGDYFEPSAKNKEFTITAANITITEV